MFPRKGQKRDGRSAKTLCLVLFVLAAFLFTGCAGALPGKQEDVFVFGEEYPDFPEGRPASAVYLQTSGAGAFQADGRPLFPEDAADWIDLVYLAFARFNGKEIALPAVPEEARSLQEEGVSLLVSFSANAADSSARLAAIAADPEQTAAFADQLTAAVKEAGLDGVDLDWEAVSGGARPTAEGMNALCRAIREAGGKDFLLTCAVPASPWGLSEDRFDFQTLSGLVDYFNLMSYDLGKNDRATHTAPLYPSGTDGGFGLGAVTGAETLAKRGVYPGRILLGCIAYGRVYACTDGEARPGAPARPARLDLPEGAYDGMVQGRGLEEILSDPAWKEVTEERDGAFVGSYLVKDDLFVSFDSDAAYNAKLAFARRTGCGVMLWSLTQDTGGRFYNALRRAGTE